MQFPEPFYTRDILQGREAVLPAALERSFELQDSSNHHWHVFTEEGRPLVRIRKNFELPLDLPEFTRPKDDNVQLGVPFDASAAAAVDDGWLVAYNGGEWGGALYWFSHDGERSYKISRHQVVDFFSLKDGTYAIQGLAHLSMSFGSVIRVARPKADGRWQSSTEIELPGAPCAISARRDGTLLIALSDSLVSVDSNHQIQTLLQYPPGGYFFPNSSVLTQNEQVLYIGMLRFVGEFDLATREFRLLIPSIRFLDNPPEKV